MYRKLFTFLIFVSLFGSCENVSSHRKSSLLETEKSKPQKQKKEQLQIKKGEEYTVKVVGISDGDTFTGLTADNQQIRCRIYGIDAPEKKQAFGNRSKQYLSDLIFGKTVCIKIQRKSDRYGRPIVWVHTLGSQDVGGEMLKSGMAWHYKEYSDDAEYANLENQARNAKIGLWADKNAVAPWEWRHK